MSEEAAARELGIEEVRFEIPGKRIEFTTTNDLEPLDSIVGQPRAMKALDLGLGIRHRQHHIYVAGLRGTGRMDVVRNAIKKRLHDEPIPPDWIYVNNFSEPDRPIAISLPAGQACALKREMDTLIDDIVGTLPKAFQHEDFGKEKDRLRRQYRERSQSLLEELDTLAKQSGMTAQLLPDGQLVFIPLNADDKPMSPEEVQDLSPEEMKQYESNQDDLVQKAAKVLTTQQEMERQLTSDVREVAKKLVARVVEPMITAIATKCESEEVREWLEQLHEHIAEHQDLFREQNSEPEGMLAAVRQEAGGEQGDRFFKYRVNVLVDNGGRTSVPVILEDSPNYKNLFGTIERVVDRQGRATANFSRIKAGSLHRANGGYLVINLMDALSEPLVWKELKRSLKSGALKIDVFDPLSMLTVSALKPDAIPLSAKLVALGDPLTYHLLYLHDEDFREVFRVKADFDSEMEHEAEAALNYGRFVRKLADQEDLLPFDALAVAELVKIGARLVQDREKLSTEFSALGNTVREADFWAREDEADVVTSMHVKRAESERIARSDMVAEKIQELIAEGTILVSLEEAAIGQVNGLAVSNLGDYSFGRPSRLTATVGVGAGGIINIERESRLSGKTYDKAMLILEGYLRSRYASNSAVALSASIAMEQSYGGIDGDSASVAEIVCLLSAIARIPLRQDIAVTGSINQHGQVQAIGGVNEKIEGFFDVCQQASLTGSQGVCIPASNVRNLVLRDDVVEAVAANQFHIWAAEHVDEAIALFTGMKAGDPTRENTVHHCVASRFREIAETLKGQRTTNGERILWTPDSGPHHEDPRPPLPGQGP